MNYVADLCFKICEHNIEYLYSKHRQKFLKAEFTYMKDKFVESREMISNARLAMSYCKMQLSWEKQEVFACLFMDSDSRVLRFEKIFRGTINSASVYPRVIAQKILEVNAAQIILAHNHPSGNPEPSAVDVKLTQQLKEALQLFDTKVLDHIIVGQQQVVSLASKGYL